MRAQVKRYNAGLSGMVEVEHGSWVHADDYDALAARLAAAEWELDALRELLRECQEEGMHGELSDRIDVVLERQP